MSKITDENRPATTAIQLEPIVERVAPAIPGAEKRILSYYATARKHEASVADLNGEAATLVANSGELPVAEIKERGAAIKRRQQDLSEARISLLWARHSLCESLVDGYEAHVPKAKQLHEETRTAFVEELAELGIDIYAIPNGQHNPTAARQRLEQLVEQDLAVMATRAAMNRAQAAVDALETAVRILPSDEAAHIDWPSFAADRQLAELAGLA